MLAREDQTIIAQCTPHGNGAIALLRLSGDDAVTIVDRMARLPRKKQLSQQYSHTLHYGHVVASDGSIIDQVMFLLMHGPKTFTGQHTVEITCHNNPFLIDRIIQEAITHGARAAEAGEFTRRAMASGKIDLTQAEAIHDIVTAQSQAALKKSMANLSGTFAQWLYDIEQYVIKALAWSEASFDYLEDDSEFGTYIQTFITNVQDKIAYAQNAYDSQRHIRDGVRIAIVGSVNAGKSSLFNALTQHKRAIVTDVEGTTRDSIEAGLYRDGMYWTLVDTAGLRQTPDKIEQEGIKRSFDEAHKADIVIVLVDGSRTLTDEEKQVYEKLITQHKQKSLVVYNKIDAGLHRSVDAGDTSVYDVSTHSGTNMHELENGINSTIHARVQEADTPFLINKRQAHVLQALARKLATIEDMLANPDVQYELVSYHLKDALEHLSDVTGKSISEAGMDKVFQDFCVGK